MKTKVNGKTSSANSIRLGLIKTKPGLGAMDQTILSQKSERTEMERAVILASLFLN